MAKKGNGLTHTTHHPVIDMEQTFNFQYGISREQACILCHLSAECSGCCIKCGHDGCQGQMCSQPSREHDGQRWETWMYLLRENLPHLKKFIKPELRKKYGIDRMLRKQKCRKA